jgi:hypothetical protein
LIRGLFRGRLRPDDSTEAKSATEHTEELDPSRLQKSEPLYGYVVALELAVVAVLNLVIIHGRGAPKHPNTTLAVIGLLAAIALVPVIHLRKRTLAAFAAILAAFFVTLPPVPSSLTFYHFFALAIAAGWALLIATRRRKDEKAYQAAGGRPPARAERPQRREAKARKGAPEPTGPQANRRYTPPKPKRRTPG